MANPSSSSSSSPHARLASLGRRKFVSVSALAAIIDDIRKNGLPEHASRQSIQRARDLDFLFKTETSYGKVLIELEVGIWGDGTPAFFWIAEPRATLYYLIGASNKLEAFIRYRLELHPNNITKPWTIILYNDEITAGNPLRHHNHRKVQAYYWSFLEFGSVALTSEFLWFTLLLVRSDWVDELQGQGVGQLCSHMMLSFAIMATEGFQFGDIVIWAKVAMFVADEAALKANFDFKGAGGSMICLQCRNVINKRTFKRMRQPDTEKLVPISEVDPTKFVRHTDASIVANAAFLHANAGSPHLKSLQQALGLVHSPGGALLCTSFRPATGVCFDPQHVYAVHGVLNIQVGLTLDLLKKRPVDGRIVRHQEIHEFAQGFTWPFVHAHGSSPKNVFEKRAEKGGPLQCSASEGLGCMAVLKMFLCLRVFPYACQKVKCACVALYALCDVLDALAMIPRGAL